MVEFQNAQMISIMLIGSERDDGSVFVKSDDLPLFSAVGADEQEAFDNAMAVLPEYIKANVPDFIDLKRLPSATSVISGETEGLLPAHIIAYRGADCGDRRRV